MSSKENGNSQNIADFFHVVGFKFTELLCWIILKQNSHFSKNISKSHRFLNVEGKGSIRERSKSK